MFRFGPKREEGQGLEGCLMGAAVEFIKFISGFLVGYTFIGGGSKGGVSPLGGS